MTNHVHLLLTPQHDDKAASRLMQFLGKLYVRRFNYNYARSGSLFEDRFKSCLVQDDIYLLTCHVRITNVRHEVARKSCPHSDWAICVVR